MALAGLALCHPYFAVLFGLVDLMVVASLLAGTLMQARFLPHSYSSCQGATDWRNGTDGRNFFVEAEGVLNIYGPPDDLCYKMVKAWINAIVAM